MRSRSGIAALLERQTGDEYGSLGGLADHAEVATERFEPVGQTAEARGYNCPGIEAPAVIADLDAQQAQRRRQPYGGMLRRRVLEHIRQTFTYEEIGRALDLFGIAGAASDPIRLDRHAD